LPALVDIAELLLLLLLVMGATFVGEWRLDGGLQGGRKARERNQQRMEDKVY